MAQDFFEFDDVGQGFDANLPTAVDQVNPSAVLSSSSGIDALNDPQFLSELMEYYGKKNTVKDPSDLEELFDEFYSDQTWDSMNSVAAAHDIIETKGMDDRQVLLKGRIKQVYDSLPNFYEEGGRGARGFGQNAMAAVLDPINVVGFGSGAVAAKAAMRAGTGITQRQALGRAAKAGAAAEFVVGTGIGAVQDTLQQGRDLATGIQDEFSVGRTVVAAGQEGLLSAGLGGLFGLAGGAASIQARAGDGASTTAKIGSAMLAPARATGRGLDVVFGAFGKQFTLQAENARLRELGFTDAQIADMVSKGEARYEIATILKNSIPADEYNQRVDTGNAEGIDPATEEEALAIGEELPASDPRFQDLQARLSEATSKIQARQTELQTDLAKHRAAGDTENQAQVEKELTTIVEMEGLPARIAGYEADIYADMESPDATKRNKAKKRLLDLRRLVADFDNFSKSGDTVDAQAVVEGEAVLTADATPQAQTPPTAPAPTQAAVDTTQATPVEPTPAVAEPTQTNLDEIQFSTPVVRRTAEKAGLLATDFDGLTGTTKSGKFSQKDVKAIIAARQGGDAPAATTSQPVTAPEPETVTPEPEVAVEETPTDAPPIEYVMASDGTNSFPGFLDRTSGTVIARLPDGSAVSGPLDQFDITPLSPQYRSINQEQSIGAVLREIGKTEEDLVEALAQGIIPVAKDGTIKQIKRPNLIEALKSFDAPEVEVDAAYQARAERVLTAIDTELGGQLGELLLQQPNVVRRVLEDRDPEFGGRIFDELMSAADDPTSTKLSSKGEEVFGKAELTVTEQKKVRQLQKNMQARGMPEAMAKLSATYKVLKERDVNTEKTSGDLSGPLSRPPIETTAGRTTFNKIQSFLKKGEFLGRAPTIPEGLDPDTKTIYGYDNAVAAARKQIPEEYEVQVEKPVPTEENPNATRTVVQKRTRYVDNTGVQFYVSEGGEAIADGKGSVIPRAGGKKNLIKPEIAKRGDELWYDPITNKAYRNEANMRMARGEGPNQTHYTSTDVPVETDKAILDAAIERWESDGDLKALGQALSETGRNSLVPITSSVPDVPVLSASGKRLALRNKETGKIRVIGQNQIDEGKGIDALLGKADIEDFEVGHTRGARNSEKSEVEFEPWSPDSINRVYLTAQQASQQVVDLPPARFVEEIEGLKELTNTIPMAPAQRQSISGLLDRMIDQAGSVDKLSFSNAIDSIEATVGWPRVGQGDLRGSYAEFFTALHTFRNTIMPDDVRKPSASLSNAQKSLKQTFYNATKPELVQISKILDAIAEQTGGSVPEFRRVGANYVVVDNPNSPLKTNYIGVGDSDLPRVNVALHELGHWAYFNMLTPEDRLEFWKSAQGYIAENGLVDEARLGQSIFNFDETPQSSRSGARRYQLGGPENSLEYRTNAFDSPQEWFANQFANWAMNERVAPEFRQDSYWNKAGDGASDGSPKFMQKVAGYIKSLVDFYINKKAIDPNLVPLFSKILPDEVQAAALADGVTEPVTEAGKALHRRVIDLSMTHDDLLEAVLTGNDDLITLNADILARSLYGIAAPSQARSNKAGEAGKPFMLMGRTHKIAQTLYTRLFEALGEDVSTLSVSDVENTGFSFDAVSRDVQGQAKKITDIVRGTITDEGDPRFETSELMGTIISDAMKAFNKLSGEPVKMSGGYPSIQFAPKKPLKGYAKYSAMLRKGTAEKKAKQKRLTKKTRSDANAARLNKSPTIANLDDGEAINFRTATPAQLADDVAKYGETDYGKMLARQMKENERSAPLSDEVEPQFLDNKWTIDAVAQEINETQGISTSTMSPGARSGLNVAQEKLSHRDADKLNVMRTVFYRMANLTGAKRPTHRMHQAMLGISDVDEVAGRINSGENSSATPTLAPSNRLDEFIEVDSDEFNELRKKLRSLATNLSPKSDAATGQKGAKLVLQDVIRAVVIMDPTQTMHRDIWRRTFGSINQGGKGLPVTQENWTQALNDLVLKTSKNLSSNDPDLDTDAFVHSVKQHVAYLVNGQMDTRIKKAHPVLDSYGNVFTGQSAVLKSEGGIDRVFYPSRYDDEAYSDHTNLTRITNEYWKNSPQSRRDAINKFTGENDPNNPPKFYVLSVADVKGQKPHVLGERGVQPQITRDSRYGNGAKLRETTPEVDSYKVQEAHLGALRAAGATESDLELFEDLNEVVEILQDADLNLIAQSQRREAEGASESNLMEIFKAGEENLFAADVKVRNEINNLLRKYKIEPMDGQKFQPVYMGKSNLFDFTIDMEYGADDITALRQIFAQIDPRGVTNTDAAINMIDRQGYISGDALHMEFVDVIKEVAESTAGRPISNRAAAEKLNAVLREYNYEGIRGHDDNSQFSMLFEPENMVKHTMADDFDQSGEITGYLYNKGEVTETNNQVITTLQSEGKMTENQTVTMQEQLHEAGVSNNAVSGLGQISRGKIPGDRQASALRRGLNIGLGENSHNLRRFGLSWVADWMSPARMAGVGHYERLAVRTSNHISPIFEALNGLPGGGGIKNWLRKASDFRLGQTGIHHALGVDQPRAYTRIVNAIRRGPDSNAAKGLTKLENLAYSRIQNAFKNIHYELVEAGVMVGRVKDYFPQVWNVEKMLRDPEGFNNALARYFISEAERLNDEVLHPATAMERAKKVYTRLVDDDGVYTPAPEGASKGRTDDHVDYQRLIRLDEFKEHLDDVGQYLENDLEAIVSKYADNAVRRIDMAEKYGTNNHGFHDYLAVVSSEGMVDTIAGLLSKKVVARKIIVNKMEQAVDETLEIRRESPMPFEGDEIGARNAATQILRLAEKGEPALRQFFDSLDSSRAEPAFSKRADAIIGAVLDRQKMGGPIDYKKQKFALGAMDSLQRKGSHGYGIFAEYGHTTSKVLRNFNAITLLGSTVLTSLGDAVLPLVRSGSLMAYSKAMAKHMTDPHYRRMTRNIGAALENQIHERMTGLYGADSSRNTTAFFNATLLSPWTSYWRGQSSAVGFEWFKAEYNIALANFDPRLELTKQNRKFKKAHRVLRAYGLDELLATNERIDNIDSFIPDPKDSPARADAKERMQMAVIKFANQTIFTPNANDIPLLAQSPAGQIIYQLKSFPIMMGRLTYDVTRQATTVDPVTQGGRRFSPLLMLSTVAPLAGGGVANVVKDVLQARGEDNKREVRDRSYNEIAEQMGWDSRIHGEKYGIDADKWVGIYIEGMMQMGGLGLLADIFYQTAEQADNGVYGRARMMSVFGGPSVGLANDAFTVVQGLADGDDGKNYPERAAARAVATRVPVLGGHRDVRDAMVDALGGKPKNRGGVSKSDFLKAWRK